MDREYHQQDVTRYESHSLFEPKITLKIPGTFWMYFHFRMNTQMEDDEPGCYCCRFTVVHVLIHHHRRHYHRPFIVVRVLIHHHHYHRPFIVVRVLIHHRHRQELNWILGCSSSMVNYQESIPHSKLGRRSFQGLVSSSSS